MPGSDGSHWPKSSYHVFFCGQVLCFLRPNRTPVAVSRMVDNSDANGMALPWNPRGIHYNSFIVVCYKCYTTSFLTTDTFSPTVSAGSYGSSDRAACAAVWTCCKSLFLLWGPLRTGRPPCHGENGCGSIAKCQNDASRTQRIVQALCFFPDAGRDKMQQFVLYFIADVPVFPAQYIPKVFTDMAGPRIFEFIAYHMEYINLSKASNTLVICHSSSSLNMMLLIQWSNILFFRMLVSPGAFRLYYSTHGGINFGGVRAYLCILFHHMNVWYSSESPCKKWEKKKKKNTCLLGHLRLICFSDSGEIMLQRWLNLMHLVEYTNKEK